VIRAEDSRIMTDMESMRRAYTELYTYNNQLISGYNIRASNHENLLAALKEVNLMIQRAANLRVGTPKTTVVTECRAAVKGNNMTELLRIVKTGSNKPSS
jgi:Bardet-Biedl syndrome 2 protein